MHNRRDEADSSIATDMSIDAKEANYQLAQPDFVRGHPRGPGFENVSPSANSPLIRHEKQGHNCCGGCCDVRRAVSIVNLINAVLLLIGIAGVLAAKKAIEINNNQRHDDWFATMKYQDDWFAAMKYQDDWFGGMKYQDDWLGNATFQDDWWIGNTTFQDDWFKSMWYDMAYDEEFSMWSGHKFSHLPLGQLVAALISMLAVRIAICAIGITGALLYSKCMVVSPESLTASRLSSTQFCSIHLV